MNIYLSPKSPMQRANWLAALLCLGIAFHGTAAPATNAVLVPKTREPIRPIPLTVKLDARKVALGDKLFHEPRLSKDSTVSCASCHELSKGGTDRLVRSVGIKGIEGTINAPTVFNCNLNFKQFWDGRADTLEEQVDGPMQAPAEMGASWEEMVAKLQRLPEYTTAFKAAYTDGIQRKNIKDAIAEFERSLITPNSRFDQYLRGDEKALTEDEKEGYRKFKGYGCISCHQGVNVGGNMFQPLGVMGDYFGDRGNITKSDLGRFNVTGEEDDKYKFKVASLRNIALTGPYFHDGSAKTLEDAVNVMAKYQLGRELPPKDLEQVVKFLRSLTGEYNGKLLQ